MSPRHRAGHANRLTHAAWTTLAVLAALTQIAAADSQVGIMTYNIYWGGGDQDPVFGRHHEWLRVIESRNPDIIMFQEANGWLPSEQNLIAAYVDSLNAMFPSEPPFNGRVADAVSGFNVALITRFPILEFEQFQTVYLGGGQSVTLYHVFLHAALDVHGERVHVVGVHFRPGLTSRVEREREARGLLVILDGLPPGEKVWVMGDFNSYSPVDVAPGSPTPPAYQHGAAPAEVVGYEPMQYLIEAGFVDAFRTAHPLQFGYTKDTTDFYPFYSRPIQRVDFLNASASGPWTLVSAVTPTGGYADQGSDHYPVCAVYERRNQAGMEDGAASADGLELRIQPNPVSTNANLAFTLLRPATVRLRLFAPDGRCLRTFEVGERPAGVHSLSWDGRDGFGGSLADGCYYLDVETGAGSCARRIVKLSR